MHLYTLLDLNKGQDARYAKEYERHAKRRIQFQSEKSFNNVPTTCIRNSEISVSLTLFTLDILLKFYAIYFEYKTAVI